MLPPDALASLISSIPDPAFLKDRHHRWLQVNLPLCQLLGLPPEDILGRTDAEIFAPTLAIQFTSSDDQVLASRQPLQTPWRADRNNLLAAAHVHRHGIVEARSHQSVIVDAAGDPYVLGIVRDITETRTLEDSLAQARALARSLTERRSDFISSLASTLQDPLRRMRDDASALRHLVAPGEATRLSRNLEESSLQLLDLVHDLFDLAPDPFPSRPASVVQESMDFSRPAVDIDDDSSTLQTTAGLRVLVVEDNRTNQFILRQQLEKLGCRSWLAEDGRQALDHLERDRFDIVLMDCQMPVMDGFEATRHWRRMEAERSLDRTPIVAVTTLALQCDKDECIVSGMDAVLPKPLRLATLEDTLLHWTRRTMV